MSVIIGIIVYSLVFSGAAYLADTHNQTQTITELKGGSNE